jgi:nucleoside-diphosphate-sugar epimerase
MLLEKGYVVRGASRSFKTETLDLAKKYPNFEIVKTDLTAPEVFKDLLEDVDFIIHLAGLAGEKQCQENPKLAQKINVEMVRQLNSTRQGIPLIFLSSTSVYGTTQRIVCDENTPPAPELAYAKSKHEGEMVLKVSDNIIILRAATFFGYAPAINYKLLVNDFVLQAVKNKKLEIYDDTLNRTFIHVRDLARAIIFITENFATLKNEVYNVGNNELNCTKWELAQTIKTMVDFELIVRQVSGNTDKRDFIVNYNKIERSGYRTQISLVEGIKELIAHI